jgi:anti-sigma factor RsiW
MEGMDIRSREHEELLELCAASVSERLSPEEETRLSAHLAVCEDCRTKLGQYRAIEQFVLPIAGSAGLEDEELEAVSPERRRKALEGLLDALRSAHPSVRAESPRVQDGISRKPTRKFTPAFPTILRYAAGILVAASIFSMGYRLADQRARKSETSSRPVRDETPTLAQEQVASLVKERAQLNSKLAGKNADEARLVSKIHQQELEIEGLVSTKRALEESNDQKEKEKGKFNADRDALLTRLNGAEQDQAQLKGDLDSLQRERDRELARAVALDTRVAQLKELLSERDEMVSRQRELLADDRDIRELMGARDLYITEVHDVGRDGKTQKPFARVFYTKAQSLIFYAYDLDQQSGTKTASTFQAWGVRDGDQKQPLSLGIFYSDNDAKKRWRLRFDDPRTVEQLNAVFVTVEPNGGSRAPSGKELLFAYLRVRPNHP